MMLYKRLIWLIWRQLCTPALIYIKNILQLLTFHTSKLPKTVAKNTKKYDIIFMFCTVSRFSPIYICALQRTCWCTTCGLPLPLLWPVPTNYKALLIFPPPQPRFFTFSNTFPRFFSSPAQSSLLSDDAWNFPWLTDGSIWWAARTLKTCLTLLKRSAVTSHMRMEKVLVDRIRIKMGIIFGLVEGRVTK